MRQFTYHFETAEETLSFTHTSGGNPAPIDDDTLPEWTRLSYKQCEGCRWVNSDRCPVAVGLMDASQLLGKLVSFDAITVTVEAPERTYRKKTTAQEGLSSLFGLIMATSGCPSFTFLKGLAWYHLPFASYEETLFRAIGAHLLRGYLRGSASSHASVSQEIQTLYDQIHLTNIGISQRLRYGVAPQTDSPMNAIVILDSFGSLVPMSAEAGLKDLQKIFL